MARPKKCRTVNCNPASYYFKPRGIPMYELEEIILEQDELEVLRLADFQAFSHNKTAEQMEISRATVGRILESARKKVVDAILNGKAIKISEEMPVQLKASLKEKLRI
jgi:predicted DNA-binding protein (UPF0251 family)